ncbi:hypothetical protein [Geomonas sp.]|uniref:hypothetical protein n=1 Tax=Geomonas sp. TaxID=2651584 RepID=UPI002B48D69D|nr:hypothetical protein [Geomonas sp.]HJV34068.1 hypothetical protein [Geomonas sp.]
MTGHLRADDHPKGDRPAGAFAPWHRFEACFSNLFWLPCLLCSLCMALFEIFFPD